MDFNEYQRLAQRTSNTRCSTTKLVNGVMGLNGEAGECIDIVKKCEFQGHDLDINKLVDEVGDVLWYIAEICTALNVDMSEVAEKNIEKLKQRYPDGFESEKSINRRE
ncbi:MAG TPA: nucleoside triphosphate pyrophosphohydrolase family protein [Tepidimicrobium sp.]|nr:nucleoside triphosphate pyrophosphohydrolase family protein [Tepidimicrobium sp.]